MYLLERRLCQNLSIRKVAELIGVSRQYYGRIETGMSGERISFKTMGLIAEALNFTLDELYQKEMSYLNAHKE